MKRPYYLLLLLFFYSCKKENLHKESVSGILLHNVTKQPLANQTVLLNVVTFKIKKDPIEAPGGIPVQVNKQYSTVTDNAGRFVFDFKVEDEWLFSVSMVTSAQYTQKKGETVYLLPGNSSSLVTARALYDTLFAEKPGYIKYHIKNINDVFIEDNVWISTYYMNKRIPESSLIFISDYNWMFPGAHVDRVIIDTIPAESEPLIPVKWLHKKSMDTVVLKNENIAVQPFTISDYYIQY